jgi:hypothetical protein
MSGFMLLMYFLKFILAWHYTASPAILQVVFLPPVQAHVCLCKHASFTANTHPHVAWMPLKQN